MTFQELMDCWNRGAYNCNRAVYDKILEYAIGNNLVPVVGAGLSAWVEYPMWDELLRCHGAEFDVEEAVEEHLASWRYDEAAEVMAKACGDAWFDILRDSFDPQQIAQRRGNRPVYQKWLPQLFKGLVLTTNFDRCLEDLYGDPDSVNPGDDFQRDRADRARFENKHLLIKLHGDINDPWNMVLTKSAYDKCYGGDPEVPNLEKPMPANLSKQVNNRPMLFLGCSLHQDRTCAVLRACSRVGSHYALLPRPKDDDEFTRRRKELRDLGITPIWYPTGKHDEALSAFFTQLAADCGLREETEIDTPIYPLVGRDEVVAALCAHYSAPTPEPRWITGVAGIGKTEVCREVIRRLTALRPHFRMPMVDCTNAQKTGLFYSAVARGCGLEIPAQEASAPGEFLARTIPTRYSGVYFDNFEDVWRGFNQTERKDLVRWLLDLRRWGMSLLFSTQDNLPRDLGAGIHLEALDAGAGASETISDAEFWNMDSVKLFIHIYGEVSLAELPCLRKLIRQMEGHPLAIVLTAIQAREQLLGLRTLLDRWDAAQEVYQGNERHTSLKNALALVWKEIGNDPAATFYWALHTTCVQPIPLEFHRWLVDIPELETGMNRLQTGSLVRRVDGRITMLLPIKEQLPLLMRNWKELCVIPLHHWASALSMLLEIANDDSNQDSLKAHLLAIELMPQVCHVLDTLVEQGEKEIDRLCQLLEAARNHYSYYLASSDTLDRLVSYPELATRPEDCAIAYMYLGNVLGFRGDKNGAESALGQAEKQFRNMGNDMGLAHTLLTKAEVMRCMGDENEAKIILDQAEQLCQKLNDDLGLANIFRTRGDLLLCQRDFDGAESAYKDAEKKSQKMNDTIGMANLIQSRGILLGNQGELDKALKLLDEACAFYQKFHNMSGQASCLEAQYMFLMASGQTEKAERLQPLLEGLLPNLPLPQQEGVRDILAYAISEPEK